MRKLLSPGTTACLPVPPLPNQVVLGCVCYSLSAEELSARWQVVSAALPGDSTRQGPWASLGLPGGICSPCTLPALSCVSLTPSGTLLWAGPWSGAAFAAGAWLAMLQRVPLLPLRARRCAAQEGCLPSNHLVSASPTHHLQAASPEWPPIEANTKKADLVLADARVL